MDRVQILKGAEGIKKAYIGILAGEALDIVCLASNYEKVLGSWFDEVYSPKLYRLRTREILPDTPANRAFAKAKDQSRNQVRFLSGMGSQSDVVVGENAVVLVSYDEKEPFAVLISGQELISGLKVQFEVMWGGL